MTNPENPTANYVTVPYNPGPADYVVPMPTTFDHLGRTYTVTEATPGQFTVRDDEGKTYRGWTNTTAEAAAKRVRADEDQAAENERLRPSLRALVRHASECTEWDLPTSADTAVGAVVAIYSRGKMRPGRVVKVGRTNLTVAYTTLGAMTEAAKWGHPVNVTRKAGPFTEVFAAPEWVAARYR